MNAVHRITELTAAPRAERGFTLVELMVTVAIAVFLLFGLVTIVENVRLTYYNQQALVQLQDEQRFAMSVLTDVIQNGGYMGSATLYTPQLAFPAAASGGTPPAYQVQSGFTATHTTGTPGGPDQIGIRYLAGPNDQAIQCDGSVTNTGAGVYTVFTNILYVVPAGGSPWAPGAAQGQLMCSVNGAAAVPIVSGVQNMVVYFGVKRNGATSDYNVDTYLTADQMCNTCGPSNTSDWTNISSVMVILYFTNPLYGQAGQTQQTIAFQRVIEVMSRAGVHT